MLLPAALAAQPAQMLIQHFSREQGLSSEMVSRVLQDSKGFLWIGTNNGLNRYDGVGFKVFKQDPDDTESLPYNDIMSLYEDRSGTLWAGTTAGLARYNPTKGNFSVYQTDPKDPNSLSSNFINGMYEDKAGQFWVVSLDNGLNLMDRAKGTFKRYAPDPNFSGSINATFSSQIMPDRHQENAFWVCIKQKEWKLYHFNTIDKSFTGYDLQAPELGQIFTMHEDRRGILWIGTDKRLVLFDTQKNALLPPENNTGIAPDFFTGVVKAIFEDHTGTLWVGTFGNGLYETDPLTGQFKRYVKDPADPGSFSSNAVTSIMEDRSGILWVGTATGGLNRLTREKNAFSRYTPYPDVPGTQNSVAAISMDRSGALWVGITRDGFFRMDREKNKFQTVEALAKVMQSAKRWGVLDVCEDRDGRLWLASNVQSIFRLDADRKTLKKFAHDPDNPASLSGGLISALLEDRSGNMWFGTLEGLDRLDGKTETFIHHQHDSNQPASLADNFISSIFEDRSGILWIGTGGGLSMMNPGSTTFRNFLHAGSSGKNQRSVEILTIFQDHTGAIWAGSPTGLYKLVFPNPGGDPVISRYTEKDGLLSNSVCGIQEDGQGRLWLNTYNGLSVFKNPGHDAQTAPNFKNYDEMKTRSGGFNNAFLKMANGEMVLGDSKGVLIFHPDSLKDNPNIPLVTLTAFEKFDTKHPEHGAIEEKGIADRTEVTLSYTNNIFTIHFSALDFREPGDNRYAYKLEGFSDNWIQLGTQRQVTFTNLDPGTYTFHVKGSNNDGAWNETGASLKIIITPPWWKTAWAYAMYVLLLIAAIAAFIRARLRYFKNRTIELEQAVTKGTAQISAQKEQLEVQAEKLHELDRLKTNFYTNITHEFRTPLTVILGMAEQAETYLETPPLGRFRQAMDMIRRNGQNLLQLINQLLDLSKLDAGTLRLQLVQDEIIGYIGYLLESFQSFAETKNIQLEFAPALPALYMDFDPEKVQSIVANLVSNAIKFTPANGSVAVSIELLDPGAAETLAIRVQDTGLGIPADQVPYIFDRFYQVDGAHTRREEGTGIGLALVRELVKLMGGEIGVDSRPGEGATFTVSLPVHRSAAAAAAAAIPAAPAAIPVSQLPETPQNNREDLPLLLIVEDNSDVAHYLQACVSDDYQVVIATDGQAGIERAFELVPDLIVSDVMMPEKDGFELCETLKNDERSSHIPIVLLTAKADMASRIKGLSRGADAYLAKPFHREELMVQLQALLQLRRSLQARYTSLAPLPANSDVGIQIEDRFLAKVRDLLTQNLADETFGVNEIAAGIYLSPSQLFRKIKALTGHSPTLYLRSLRLQKGRDLLKTTDLSIAEVAYEVGFSDPAYFSRAFSQEFGVAPSAARR